MAQIHGKHSFSTGPGEIQLMASDSIDNTWVPLVDYRRNGVPECTIHGAVAWVHGKELVHSFGGNVLCYGRSTLKPFFMKVFADVLDDMTWEQKAIAVASHNGDTEHVRAARSILSEGEYKLMRTPHSLPLMQFGKQRRRPRRWYNNSSGVHAAVLRACRKKGWERAGYCLPQHPFHQAFLEEIRKVLGSDWKPQVTAKDGDNLPTVSQSVNELAQLFSYLVRTKDEDWIWEALVKEPDLIGGFNRLDSTILKSCEGKVIAKEGADGLLGLSILHDDFPEGLGIVVKVAHGWDTTATWFVARYILGVLGFQFRNPYPLYRQKGFIVNDVIPPTYQDRIKDINPWDDWDPDKDRWFFDHEKYVSL